MADDRPLENDAGADNRVAPVDRLSRFAAERVRPNRALLAGAVLVFAGLWIFANVPLAMAGLGLATIVILTLTRSDETDGGAVRESAATDWRGVALADEIREIFEALPQGAILIDGNGRVLIANGGARRLFGPVAAGVHVSVLMRAPDILKGIELARTTGQVQTVSYFERVPINLWLEVRAAAISPQAGGGLVLLLIEDMTRQRQAEKMRTDFVANASHELRTPLASLLGFVETLQGSARDDPAARDRFLEIMREQAMRMSRLISDLMSLSRIEANVHVPPDRTVDLRPLIGHVCDTLAGVAEEAGVDLVQDMPEGLPMVILGEPDELTQVFQNLVENAIKYGQSGGRVEVSVRTVAPISGDGQGPRRIEVSVRDFGPGIAEEHVPRLTERFYRVDTATSREKGGTGLGLAIVKHILNRHRARLVIDSEVGKGTTFSVRFDARQAADV